MITFHQFLEMFDSAPAAIDWSAHCDRTYLDYMGQLTGIHVSKDRHGKDIQFGNRSGEDFAGLPKADKTKGCFQIGRERYVVQIDFSTVDANLGVKDAIKKDPDGLGNVLKPDMSVAEISFYRINRKGEGSYGIDNTGNVGQVFNTVMAGAREATKSRNLDVVAFTSKADSRTRLYRQMVKRFGNGYQLYEQPVKNETTFFLVKAPIAVSKQQRSFDMA